MQVRARIRPYALRNPASIVPSICVWPTLVLVSSDYSPREPLGLKEWSEGHPNQSIPKDVSANMKQH